MAQAVVSKRCPRCGFGKPTADFYKNRSSRDGFQQYCKPCNKAINHAYETTPAGRAMRLAQVRRYQKTNKGQMAMKRVDQKRKDTPQVKARAMVRDMVFHGRMPSAKTLPCAYCGEPANQYHHHLGYDREHWKHVLPICQPCHKKQH